MIVWELQPIGDIYQLIAFHETQQLTIYEFENKLKNYANTGEWKEMKMQLYRSKRRKICDNPNFVSGFPVFSENAVAKLNDLLVDKADILPLDCGDEKYYLINVHTKDGCIDYSKSQYNKYDWGAVREFTKYAFFADKVKKENIFKIPEFSTYVYVTDEFKKRVEYNNLVGFNFVKLWDENE